MTRSFWRRTALAAPLLAFGLYIVWGKHSLYDKLIAACGTMMHTIVIATFSGLLCLIAISVCRALYDSWRQRAHKDKTIAMIAVISAGLISAQNSHAWTMVPKEAKSIPVQKAQAVEIDQPFTLSPDEQRQVDAVIADVSKEAQDQVGFTVSVEMAIGLFIAAVVIGTTLYIIVRMVCKSLDKMKQSLNSRLSKLKDFLIDPTRTNDAPVVLGAALFNHRSATTNDLPAGRELALGFTAEEPVTLAGKVASGETVTLGEFVADFGLSDKLPDDSVAGPGVVRGEGEYRVRVAPAGVTNFVSLAFESTSKLAQSVWSRAVTIRVPAGAVLDFADLTGNSEGRYWRVGVAQ